VQATQPGTVIPATLRGQVAPQPPPCSNVEVPVEQTINGVIVHMEELLRELTAGDDRARIFHAAYLRVTCAVRDAIRDGAFEDPDWVERWDVAFACLYLEALDRWRRGQVPSSPWTIAFGATRSKLQPVRHVLLGINAHINYDLPQALLAVISDEEFADAEIMRRRGADHERIDVLLSSRVAVEDKALAEEELPGDRTLIDHLMQPLNRAATKRFLREARRKVWQNAVVLSGARQAGQGPLDRRLAELERRSADRVTDLLTPRFVLLELAVHGFGVTLSP